MRNRLHDVSHLINWSHSHQVSEVVPLGHSENPGRKAQAHIRDRVLGYDRGRESLLSSLHKEALEQ